MKVISVASEPPISEINMSDTDTAGSDKENIQNQVKTKVMKNPLDNTIRQLNTRLKVIPSKKKQKIEGGALKYLRKSHRKDQKKYQALLYDEPKWVGIPKDDYKFMVSENGIPLDIIDLSSKSSHILGKLQYCTIRLNQPTISRYHAIIQYRSKEDEKYKPGMFICDLGSSYGTFINGCPVIPNTYVQITDGDIVGFGYSRRTFVLLVSKNVRKEAPKKLEKDTPNGSKTILNSWFEKKGFDSEIKIEFEGTKSFARSIKVPTENCFDKDVLVEVRFCDKEEEVKDPCVLSAYGIFEGKCFSKQNWENRDFSTSRQRDSSDNNQKIEIGQNSELETMVQECALLMQNIKKLEDSLPYNKYLTVDPFLNPAILKRLNNRQVKCVLENLRKKDAQLLNFLNPLSKSFLKKDLDDENLLVEKLKRDITQEEFSAPFFAYSEDEKMSLGYL